MDTDLNQQTKRPGFWIMMLLAAQPLLDALAFWTRNDTVTPAGLIRLFVLLLFPVLVFFVTREKKKFFLFLCAVCVFCVLHILNSIRCGYIDPVTDIRYLASVVQMPVFAVCFLLLIRDNRTRDDALRGIGIAALLTLLFLILARVSGTGNVTYGEGLGYSGWVIDENRNANSTNLVVFGCFAVLFALCSGRFWYTFIILFIIDAVYIVNGTKGCYFSLFVIFLGFAGYLLAERVCMKKHQDRRAAALLVLFCLLSAAIYPWTPRCKVTEAQQKTARGTQGEIEATLLEKGIDITDMSPQERFDNPTVKEVFSHYYWKYLGVKPDLIDRFTMDRVLMQYRMSTDVASLIDARVMERQYAAMVFQDCDTVTRLFGFEVSEMGPHGYDGVYDMENDWHAIFYYYGWVGFLLYVGFILYFVFRILRTLRNDFSGSMSLLNFSLLLGLALSLGLAHFSGAMLRRPNVSIWLSVILALIWYQTSSCQTRLRYGGAVCKDQN